MKYYHFLINFTAIIAKKQNAKPTIAYFRKVRYIELRVISCSYSSLESLLNTIFVFTVLNLLFDLYSSVNSFFSNGASDSIVREDGDTIKSFAEVVMGILKINEFPVFCTVIFNICAPFVFMGICKGGTSKDNDFFSD